MNRLATALTLAFLLCTPSLAQAGETPCKKHSECSDIEVCHDGKCESAVGRTYLVTVEKAKIAEKRTTNPNKGKAWDPIGGLPDPRVEVRFPSINKKAFAAKAKKNTLSPEWNATSEIVVTAAGQEIWFCFTDQDAAENDPLRTDASGKASCLGRSNVLDFIRAGVYEKETDADVKYFKASIKRK